MSKIIVEMVDPLRLTIKQIETQPQYMDHTESVTITGNQEAAPLLLQWAQELKQRGAWLSRESRADAIACPDFENRYASGSFCQSFSRYRRPATWWSILLTPHHMPDELIELTFKQEEIARAVYEKISSGAISVARS